MKITFVLAEHNLSGGNRVIAIYAKHLRDRGHDVFVISPLPKSPPISTRLKSLVKGKGWPSSITNNPRYFDDLAVPYCLINKERPIFEADVPDADIVIATWWTTAEWINRLSPKKGTKVYFVQHHEVFDYLPQDQVAATYRLPFHKIVVTRWLQKLMEELYGDSTASMVPNSVNCKQFYALIRTRQQRPTVGTLYDQTRWKGGDIVMAACTLAAQTLPQLCLKTFGIHQPEEPLLLPPFAEFTQNPPQSEIKDIYGQCDAWLFGSRDEGFGLPILEAMACRTPVIGTPAGAAPELIGQGGGVLVPPESPEEMAEAIVKICTLPNDQWRIMSDAAYATATSYTWEDATTLFEKALQMAIDSPQ